MGIGRAAGESGCHLLWRLCADSVPIREEGLAHLNGVQRVAGSNPAVPIPVSQSTVGIHADGAFSFATGVVEFRSSFSVPLIRPRLSLAASA